MRLGNNAIREEKTQGNILISPFDDNLLNACSYDITLDEFFVSFKDLSGLVFDPSIDDIDTVVSCFQMNEYVLPPLSRVLGRSREKIGGVTKNITSQLASRSTWGRHGLEICSCAGYGDPGYAFNWTLEIFNKNRYSIRLRKGMIIGQIFFDRVEKNNIIYQSKYNDKELNPFDTMLPKKVKVFSYN